MMLGNSWAHMGSSGTLTKSRQHLCPWLCWSPKDTSAISIALCFDWVSKLFFFFIKISVSLQLFHPITCEKFKAFPKDPPFLPGPSPVWKGWFPFFRDLLCPVLVSVWLQHTKHFPTAWCGRINVLSAGIFHHNTWSVLSLVIEFSF